MDDLAGAQESNSTPGKRVFVRTAGIEGEEVWCVLNVFTLQGSVPEPVRVAKLLARAELGRRY